MTRGQIWPKFPKLLRFMALFPSLSVGMLAETSHYRYRFSLALELVAATDTECQAQTKINSVISVAATVCRQPDLEMFKVAHLQREIGLRTRRPCTGVKIPKIGKRGFRGQKTPISRCSRKGRFESKNPHFSTGLHKENGDFLTQIALFWGIGKWEFFDPETLFSRFWGFWPLCRADAFAKIGHTNTFWELWIFLRKMLQKFPRYFWAFILWVCRNPANSRQISHQSFSTVCILGAL